MTETNALTTVVINVTFNEDVETVKKFIVEEQIPFVQAQNVDKLKRFEWFFSEDDTSATLIEIFEDATGFAELGGKVIGTPVNLRFREMVNIEKLTVLGSVSDEFKEKLKPMGAEVHNYMGGFLL